MTDLLILGGTSEARLLCDKVRALGIDAMVSLAGATSDPAESALPARSGAFGGVAGLSAWLDAQDVRLLIDATHPFAVNMPWNAFHACASGKSKRLRLLRPTFPRAPGWLSATDLVGALSQVPTGAKVLLTTGRQGLDVLATHPNLHLTLRTIEPICDLPEHVTHLRIKPPLDLNEEIRLLREHRIETLIAKDSGGVTATKLEAADQLGIQVILTDRPAQPPGPTVETVDQAVAWLEHVVGFGD